MTAGLAPGATGAVMTVSVQRSRGGPPPRPGRARPPLGTSQRRGSRFGSMKKLILIAILIALGITAAKKLRVE